MSIQKKSLISTLKATRKANVAKEEFPQAGAKAHAAKVSPSRMTPAKATTGKVYTAKATTGKAAGQPSSFSTRPCDQRTDKSPATQCPRHFGAARKCGRFLPFRASGDSPR